MKNKIAIIGGGNLGAAITVLNEMGHRGFSSSLMKGVATSYKKIVKD